MKAHAKNFNEGHYDGILAYMEIACEGLAPGSHMPFLYKKFAGREVRDSFHVYSVRSRGNLNELHVWKVK